MNQLLSRQNLAWTGIALARNFLKANNLAIPAYVLSEHKNRYGVCGYFESSRNDTGLVMVSVPMCAHRNPKFSWPGFISDRTPLGVLAHETGHFVDWQMGDVASRIRKATKERAITSYTPNDQEWFAEMFRLFITNPDLLKAIRPLTYREINTGLGLDPVVHASYTEVLKGAGAPPQVFERIKRFLP